MYARESPFARWGRMLLFVLTAAVPLWFIPVSTIGIDAGREITFGVLILGVVMLWLLRVLISGEIRYHHSPLLWMEGLILIFFGAATFLSRAPLVSVLFADPAAEKFLSVALFVLLAAVGGSVLRNREHAGTLIFVLVFSTALSALLALVQLLGGPSLLKHLMGATGIDANVIGTVNGLALFYAVVLAMTAGLCLSGAAREWHKWIRWLLGGAMAVFLADLIIINFLTAWIVLLGTSIFLFGLAIIQNRMARRAGSAEGIGVRYWAALALVAFSVVMILIRAPMVPGVTLAPEVSPSLSATLSVAKSVFKEGTRSVFFGSGPGTFGLDWARYKDPALNQTIFWNAGFTQGNSWVGTLLATNGVLGALIFALFLIGGVLLFLRILLTSHDGASEMHYVKDPFVAAAFFGNTASVIAAFLYPSTFSLGVLLFLTSGLLILLMSHKAGSEAAHESLEMKEEIDAVAMDEAGTVTEEIMMRETTGYGDEEPAIAGASGLWRLWAIEERKVRFKTPWAVFLSSLAVIFFLSLGVFGLYVELGRVRAVLAVGAGVAAANRGDLDGAIANLERAGQLENNNNFRTYELLGAARTEKIRRIIQRAAGGENVSQEFQSVVSQAVQDLQHALTLHPADMVLWRTAGALYELVIPYVPGSERLAFSSYQKAVELSPTDPSVYVDWGRAGLVFTDRIQSAINQSKDDKERSQLDDARKSNLQQIETIFQKAIDLKGDYAPAHFLMAQTQIRLGDIDKAIQSVENAKVAAPFDIGIAFQLGLLYYQHADMGKAEAEFSRAVSINENYSNARYFLGLIYDKKGERDKAIEQFTKIAALNPDNQEAKTILGNLQAGKPALTGIVPPEAPPEKRKQTPVQDQGPSIGPRPRRK